MTAPCRVDFGAKSPPKTSKPILIRQLLIEPVKTFGLQIAARVSYSAAAFSMAGFPR
jgi:hypothetical protein